MINGWVAIGFNEVKELLQEKSLTTDLSSNGFANLVIRSSAKRDDVPFLDYPSMQQVDPPVHTRLRKLTAAGFTHKFVQSLEPNISKLVDECLDSIPGSSFDFMEHLARPLPAIVIAEMLGVPVEDRHLFEKWSAEILGFSRVFSPTAINAAVEADISMREYLKRLIEDKRRNLGDDLLSRLLIAEDQEDALTMDELYSTSILLLMAGHETTTRLLGNCLYRLITHPDALAAARQDDETLAKALEESLRLDPPVMITNRFVKESFSYKGKRFRKGQVVLVSIFGANHDPGVFQSPDDFDIHREGVNHLSFGYGMHLCLGISLARLEARVALRKLFERFDSMSLADRKPDWEYSPFFRGMNTLNLHT
jgi:cytochrome P450 PksS